MNGEPIIQRMAVRLANSIIECETLRQENIELNQLLQTKTEVQPDGVSSDNS